MLKVQRSGNASLESLVPVADKTMNTYISSVDPLYNKMDLSLWHPGFGSFIQLKTCLQSVPVGYSLMLHIQFQRKLSLNVILFHKFFVTAA